MSVFVSNEFHSIPLDGDWGQATSLFILEQIRQCEKSWHGYVTVMTQNLFCFYTWHGTDTITARHGLMCHKGSEMGHDLMKDDIVVVVCICSSNLRHWVHTLEISSHFRLSFPRVSFFLFNMRRYINMDTTQTENLILKEIIMV